MWPSLTKTSGVTAETSGPSEPMILLVEPGGAAPVLLTHNIQSYFLDNCRRVIVPGNTQIVPGVPPGHLAQLQDRTKGLILAAAVLEVDGPPVRSPPGDAWLSMCP